MRKESDGAMAAEIIWEVLRSPRHQRCGFIGECRLNKTIATAMTSPAAHVYRRRVEFSDTDAAGVAHFSRLLAMVEEATHDFFRKHSIPVLSESDGWPVVGLQVDFRAPCRFGDELEVLLSGFSPGESSLTFDFEAQFAGSRILTGRATICHISPATGRPIPIPESIRRVFHP
ncbi:MAG: acyl-CoA thioesterase [Verrucomicrobiota bacterium]